MVFRLLNKACSRIFARKSEPHKVEFSCASQDESVKIGRRTNTFSKSKVLNDNDYCNDRQPKASSCDENGPFMKFSSFGITDVGLKRSHNEDFVYSCDELGLYLVADGMGGHAAGEIASHQSIEAISAFVKDHGTQSNNNWPYGKVFDLTIEGNALVSGIYAANDTLCALQKEKPELNGMGTTVAGLRLSGNEATLAHVGDSRIYRYRKNNLELLTNDHSWVNEQLIKQLITPEEAKNHRYRNVITRALGNRCELEVDYSTEPVTPGDYYMLCSDGLSGMIEDHQMTDVFHRYSGDLRKIANTLVNMANAAGGHDNISVIIVLVEEDI